MQVPNSHTGATEVAATKVVVVAGCVGASEKPTDWRVTNIEVAQETICNAAARMPSAFRLRYSDCIRVGNGELSLAKLRQAEKAVRKKRGSNPLSSFFRSMRQGGSVNKQAGVTSAAARSIMTSRTRKGQERR